MHLTEEPLFPPNVGNETPHWGVMFPTLWGKNQGQEI